MFWLPILIGIIIALIALLLFIDSDPAAGTFLAILATIFLFCGGISGNDLGSGEYVGTVQSVETSGLIWTTTGIAIKSDAAATEPEWFCTTDPEVAEGLRQAAIDKARVKVEFRRHAFFSDGCEFEASKRITAFQLLD